jgi:hypothetical protein
VATRRPRGQRWALRLSTTTSLPLPGDGRLVRVMRFTTTQDIHPTADELQAVIRAWRAAHTPAMTAPLSGT